MKFKTIRIIVALLIAVGIINLLSAQKKIPTVADSKFDINGVVVESETNEPLVGVAILVKGTSNSTITDLDGKFVLRNISKNSILIFSYVGYTTQEVVVKDTIPLKVIFEPNVALLEDVVVVGYSTLRNEVVTGSVTTIDSKTLKAPKSDISHAFVGSVEGVTDVATINVKSGTLTAAEVNDFAKWNQWPDILKNTFISFQSIWGYRPINRFTVQLTNMQGMPLVNAEVKLLNKSNDEVWKTLTDNTGKAELWADLFEKENSSNDYHITVSYQGGIMEIAEAKTFAEGINSVRMDTGCKVPKNVDIFFIVDATGSMMDELNYLQVELIDIINKVKNEQSDLNLRLGSLVYRDKGDEYLTRKSSLDTEFKKSIAFINEQRADGGGDYPEAIDEALFQTIEKEDWDNEALARVVFLLMDAPSHQDAESVKRFADQMRLASEKGIRIVPVACSGMQKDGEYLMRCLALATNGTYLTLTDDSGVGGSHIKPTTDKYEVEKLNEAIIRVINQYTKMPDCSNDQWVNNNKKTNKEDKFVPNPYDENPEVKASKLVVKDIIKIYPNPCRDILKVEIKQDVDDIYIVDMTGKSLYNYKAKKKDMIEIGVNGLATGIYFVKAYCKGKWFAEKVIVVN